MDSSEGSRAGLSKLILQRRTAKCATLKEAFCVQRNESLVGICPFLTESLSLEELSDEELEELDS